MKKSYIVNMIIIVFIITVTPTYAQTSKIISLKDGSLLIGQVLGMSDGVYTIKTQNMGAVKIHEADIVSIQNNDESVAQRLKEYKNSEHQQNLEKNQLKVQVEQMQNDLLSNPALMKDIESLIQNEDILSIITDPGVMKDVLSYDPERLENNEKLRLLMEQPEIKALIEKMNHINSGH